MAKSKVSKPKKRIKVKDEVVLRLYANMAGRCTICGESLLEDPFIYKQIKRGENCHIYPFSDAGTRGRTSIPPKDRENYENLMICCESCHGDIDQKISSGHYTIEYLEELKKRKEDYIYSIMESIKSLDGKKAYTIVKYFSTIGKRLITIDDDEIFLATASAGFYAKKNIISINENNDDEFNVQQCVNVIDSKFTKYIEALLTQNKSQNICLFGLAPQYLLIYLGNKFDGKYNVVTFPRRAAENSWNFDNNKKNLIAFDLQKPANFIKDNDVILKISCSAEIANDRVLPLFKSIKGADIWEIVADTKASNIVSSKEEVERFYRIADRTLDEIGATYGKDKTIHLFPAMANSLAITFGRAFNNKCHNKLKIYDSAQNGVFEEKLDIN